MEIGAMKEIQLKMHVQIHICISEEKFKLSTTSTVYSSKVLTVQTGGESKQVFVPCW